MKTEGCFSCFLIYGLIMSIGIVVFLVLIFNMLSPTSGHSTSTFFLEDEHLYMRASRIFSSDSAYVCLGRTEEDIEMKKDYFKVKVDYGRDAVDYTTSFVIRKSSDSVFVKDSNASIHCSKLKIVPLYPKMIEVEEYYDPRNKDVYRMTKYEERNYDKWYKDHRENYHSFFINWYQIDYILHEPSYLDNCQMVLWRQ